MAEDQFLLGLLGSIAQQQQNNQMSLKDIAAIEAQRAQTANTMAEGGLQFDQNKPDVGLISRMAMAVMGQGRQQPREITAGPIDPTLTQAFVTKLQQSSATPEMKQAGSKYVENNPLRSLKSLSTASEQFIPIDRKDWYGLSGVDPDTNRMVHYNNSTGKASYVDTGEPFSGDLGRLLSKQHQSVPAEEMDKAANYNQLVYDLNQVYTNFDPDNIGLFKKPLAQIRRFLPNTPETITRGRQAIEDIKRKLATAEGGKQLTPFEYKTLVQTLPDDLKSVDDFATAMKRYDESLGVILKKRRTLSQKLYGIDVYEMMGIEGQGLPKSTPNVRPINEPIKGTLGDLDASKSTDAKKAALRAKLQLK